MRVVEAWKQFRAAPAGHRFIQHYERRRQNRSRAGALAFIAIGVVLVAIGIVLLVMPGPGIVIAACGLAFIAGESAWLAKLLDRGELVVRPRAAAGKRWWTARSLATRATITSLAALVIVSAGVLTFATLRD